MKDEEVKENPHHARDMAAITQFGKSTRRVEVEGHEPGEVVLAYVKFPDMTTLSQVTKLMKHDEIGAMDQLFNKCVLKEHSDEQVFTDPEIRLAVTLALNDLVDKKKARLVKL